MFRIHHVKISFYLISVLLVIDALEILQCEVQQNSNNVKHNICNIELNSHNAIIGVKLLKHQTVLHQMLSTFFITNKTANRNKCQLEAIDWPVLSAMLR